MSVMPPTPEGYEEPDEALLVELFMHEVPMTALGVGMRNPRDDDPLCEKCHTHHPVVIVANQLDLADRPDAKDLPRVLKDSEYADFLHGIYLASSTPGGLRDTLCMELRFQRPVQCLLFWRMPASATLLNALAEVEELGIFSPQWGQWVFPVGLSEHDHAKMRRWVEFVV